MEVGFRLVDVFTETPFRATGSASSRARPRASPTEQMRMLALETNFSETTFVTESRADGYGCGSSRRTPSCPFAGHPTIGTAFTLASEGRDVRTRPSRRPRCGDVPVEVDLERGFAWMTQQPPVFGDEFDDRDVVARGRGARARRPRSPTLPMQVISTGLGPLLVPVRDEATLRRAERYEPGCRRATEASGGECLYLFAIRGDGDVLARMFDASFGVGEDPGDRLGRRSAGRLPRVARPRRDARATPSSRRARWWAGRASCISTFVRTPIVDRPRWAAACGSSGRACSACRPRPRALCRSSPARQRRPGVALIDLDDELLGDPGSNGAELV